MNADGSNVRRLVTRLENNNHTCVHPDGKSLIIVGERRGRDALSQCAVPA